MTRNVFVLGLDEQNLDVLESLPGADGYRFRPLLGWEELGQEHEVDMPALLALAERRLDSFEGTVDAVIGYWDFPVSSLVPLLCAPRGLRSTSLESVVRCEHKYWSRLEQRAVIPEAVPRFAEVDLDETAKPADLSYPLWVKPVKSFSSELAFRVTDDAGFAEAMGEIREGAGRIGDAFQWAMDRIRLPRDVEEAGGTAALAEEEAVGDQLTVEGYVRDGTPHVYAIIDSPNYPGTSSFLRYEYPSRVSEEAQERLTDLSERVIARVGLNDTTFNIEYFHEPESGAITLVEINPRHSQSHARMLELVNGVSNHEICLRLALGQEPEVVRGGEYEVAAKWFMRRFGDGFVERAPTERDVARARARAPDAWVDVVAEEGDWLSDLPIQDSYSFELAHVIVGARDIDECERRYRECAGELPFTIRGADDRARE
ncbi:acetyl-CoA carboxylase biotin carboxylase subunit family protein [Nocardiopsis sp. NRRL B-16309]|uniref:ATP-grasp domain-containing protein n=1 Tax=Nocardiopsis sp. NRRL B-16309 TaxID=1519494 RepID=UPI0006AF20D4|nr:ATP-grasp domain-containing protein [Nocardiopsis sp. NRRL B-16309]KOX10244.1 biotin carboxylase [Nocardiopsis sp. NRRL B-16309]